MHPVLFQIPTPWGPLAVYSHGVCLAAATLAGWYLWVRPTSPDARRRARTYVAAVAAGLAMGKILYATQHGGTLLDGGLSPVGFALGLAFAGWLGRGSLGDDALRSGARLVPLFVGSLALGQWLHGAAFGAPFDGATLLERLGTYPRWPDGSGAPALLAHRRLGLVAADARASLPTHPVQLYEAAAAFVTFALLSWRRPRRSVALALGSSGLVALALEPLRAQPSVVTYLGGAALLALAAVAWRRGPSDR